MFESLSVNEVIAAGAMVGALICFLAFVIVRRKEQQRAWHKLEESIKAELHIPASLHPVIDPDVCIGSGSCISACPEGEILGLIDGVATLLNGSKCIGHGKCASECPVDAIKLVFGSSERGVDLPEVDTHFETSRAGVHIVGELAGMGLIKNALVQGLQVAKHFKETLSGNGRSQIIDVAIVGAGPAGIATAVGCKAAGLSFRILEQDSLGGTVAHYPRKKFVMTDTVALPLYGNFGRPMSKEELIDSFNDVVAKTKIEVQYATKVTGLDGQDGAFTVSTTKGALNARKVVLAIGRGGTPRKLGVPGEDLEKVAYRLVDPDLYNDKQVLVVGGGDSALEAAIMLGEESTAVVAISYRRPEFGRCRPANKQKIAALIAKGRVKPLMGTEITALDAQTVTLKNGGAPVPLPNDYVIACLGGVLPTEFLQSMGISIRRHDGTKAMANPALMGKGRSKPQGHHRGLLLALLGTTIAAALLYVGLDYYLLPFELRFRSSLHAAFKPSGIWGHGIGVGASLFMLLNFVYPIRKRLRLFKGKASIAPWLSFHVFVGLMSPIVILFHSAFVWRNALATTTYVSLLVVVVTGVIGRSIYGLVQTEGAENDLKKLVGQLQPMLSAVANHGAPALDAVLARVSVPARAKGSLAGLFARMPFESLHVRLGLRYARDMFLRRADYREFRRTFLETLNARTKLAFQHRLKRLMNGWRIFHVVLSIMLLLVMAAHIVVSVKLGFKWILK